MEIAPSLAWLLGATIVTYVVAIYLLGYYAQQRVTSNEEFVVAGRRLPLSLAWMTLLATWFGAGTMLAAADEVRHEGLQAAALDPLGAGFCLLLAGLLVARPMWEMKLLTLPDFYRRKYGVAAEMVSSLIMVPSYFGWIAAQFVALAGVLNLFFGLDMQTGLVLVAVVGTGYTLMGGMWSVTLTDAVQIILILAGLVVLAVVVLMGLGEGHVLLGTQRLVSHVPEEKLVLIPRDDLVAFWQWAGLFAVGALGNLPGQDLMQRIFASRSARVAQGACYIAGLIYLLFGMIPVGLGLAAHALMPDAKQAILPTLASAFLSPPVAVIFVVTLLSAVLSTVDSAILAPASVLSQNVFPKISRVPKLRLNRLSVLLVAACSLVMAFFGESAYSLLEGAYEMSLVGLFVPLMFGLYTEPRRPTAALASMLVGTGVWLAHYVLGYDYFLEFWSQVAGWCLPVSLSATACGLLAYLLFEPPWRLKWRRA